MMRPAKLLMALLICLSVQMCQADRVPPLQRMILLKLLKQYNLTELGHIDFAIKCGLPSVIANQMKAVLLGKKLVYVAKAGLSHGVKELVKQGADVNVPDDQFGASSLIWAIANNNVDRVKFLVQQGADLNAIMAKGNASTPLIIAAKKDNVDIIRFLLEHNADVALKDKEERTALDCAYNQEIVDLLKKYGATE